LPPKLFTHELLPAVPQQALEQRKAGLASARLDPGDRGLRDAAASRELALCESGATAGTS
jgi:hypothetical protein